MTTRKCCCGGKWFFPQNLHLKFVFFKLAIVGEEKNAAHTKLCLAVVKALTIKQWIGWIANIIKHVYPVSRLYTAMDMI